MTDLIPPPLPSPPGQPAPARLRTMQAAAEAFEASFLTEMLKSAGFGAVRQEFGGGAGEEAFSSLMVRFQAERMAATGGIGIAEQVLTALMRAESVRGTPDV